MWDELCEILREVVNMTDEDFLVEFKEIEKRLEGVRETSPKSHTSSSRRSPHDSEEEFIKEEFEILATVCSTYGFERGKNRETLLSEQFAKYENFKLLNRHAVSQARRNHDRTEFCPLIWDQLDEPENLPSIVASLDSLAKDPSRSIWSMLRSAFKRILIKAQLTIPIILTFARTSC